MKKTNADFCSEMFDIEFHNILIYLLLTRNVPIIIDWTLMAHQVSELPVSKEKREIIKYEQLNNINTSFGGPTKLRLKRLQQIQKKTNKYNSKLFY